MAVPDRSPRSLPDSIVAGLAGGALAGLADAAATAAAAGPGARRLWLLLLATSLGACLGALLAAGCLALARLLGRLPGTGRWAGAAAAVVIAAPVVVFDAFALFTGAQASRLPGRHLISAVLVLVGLAGIVLVQRGFSQALAAARAGHRRVAGLWAAGCVALALLAAVANRLLLPRLYPWFHTTLTLVFLVALVLAATTITIIARSQASAAGRRRPVLLAAVCLLAVAGAGASIRSLGRSHAFLHLAHQAPLTAAVLPALAPLHARPIRREPAVLPAGASHHPQPQTPGPTRPDADVVLITIDALRADHVGAYGYKRATTPNIDALALRAVRFERAYAQAPHTSFSIASMLTGKYYPTLARLAPQATHDPVTVPLQEAGWQTAAFFPPAIFFADGDKLQAYQRNHFHFEHVKFEYADAAARLDEVKLFFAQEQPDRAFVWVHFFEPHEPYDRQPSASFGDRDIDRYDGEIAHTDKIVGQLLDYLQRTRPGAIVIVAADHGEEFDEHGGRYHGSTLFDEQVRVPLIIAVPGLAPRVVPSPVELVDIAPTVLGLIDLPVPPRMRGTDLGPWLNTPPDPAPLPPAFSEMRDKRMVVAGTDKLICDLNWGYCEYYDLTADPGEKVNLAEQRPGRLAQLRGILDGWLDDHVRYEPLLARGRANPEGGAVPRAIERGRLGDLLVLDDLLDLLPSAQPLAVRREAARLLVTVLPGRKASRPRLIAALDNPDPEIRDWIAVAAARLGVTGLGPRLRAVVAPDAESPRDPELQRHAALALAEHRDAAGLPVLAAALDSCPSVDDCRMVILALGKLGDRRATPALLAHLPEVPNRREMVEALGDIADPAALTALAERLRRDEYVPVRAASALALAKIGGADAVAALQRSVAEEREPSVLAAARQALAQLTTPPAARRPAGRRPAPPRAI
jgi:arylsulfatase A-like enzyme/HEAT repeat protein